MWFDEAVLKIGDGLSGKIDEGLAKCPYGIVILSPSFFASFESTVVVAGQLQSPVQFLGMVVSRWQFTRPIGTTFYRLALPIAKSTAGASVLAQVIVRKMADHLPLHRQAKIFRRHGVEIADQTMCGWMAQSARRTNGRDTARFCQFV